MYINQLHQFNCERDKPNIFSKNFLTILNPEQDNMQIKYLLLLLSALLIAGTEAECEHFDEDRKWGVRLYDRKDCSGQIQWAHGNHWSKKCNNLPQAATSFHAYGKDGCRVLLFEHKGCPELARYNTEDGDLGSSGARWWTEKYLKKGSKIG